MFNAKKLLLFVVFYLGAPSLPAHSQQSTTKDNLPKITALILNSASSADDRKTAAATLGLGFADGRSVKALSDTLKNIKENSALRAECARSLGRIQKSFPTLNSLSLILSLYPKEKNATMQLAMVEAMGLAQDVRAAEILRKNLLLKKSGEAFRLGSLKALAAMGASKIPKSLVPTFLKILTEESGAESINLRGEIVSLLGDMRDPTCLDVLLNAIEKDHKGNAAELALRENAARALANLGAPGTAALLHVLQDRGEAEELRMLSASLLATQVKIEKNEDAKPIVDALITIFKDEDSSNVWGAAVDALGDMPKWSNGFEETLIDRLRQKEKNPLSDANRFRLDTAIGKIRRWRKG